MDTNKQVDDISSLQNQVKELSERVENLENSEIHRVNGGHYFPCMNDKLSNYAYKTLQGSRGPLKPDELIKYFTDDVFGKKEALAVIRRFPNNTSEIKNQFSLIHENIENQMMLRKKENESDDKLIKKVRKFNKTLEEQLEKETKSKPKRQTTMDQFFDKEPQNVSAGVEKTLAAGKSKAAKRRKRVKEANKENRIDDEDDESCSSPEIEMDEVSDKLNKRLKFNSSQESAELNAFSQRREPEPMINRQSSSEGSLSDSFPDDDSPEMITKAKADVKSAPKRSKQRKLRSTENAPEYNGDEQTVNEKDIPFRGKHIR